MITVKNSELSNDTIVVLNKLIEMDIKASIAFKLMRIIKDLSSIIEDKLSMEKKIFDKYVEKDDFNNPALVYDENNNLIENAYKIIDLNAFNLEMKDLLGVINTINHDKINFEEMELDFIKIKDLLKIDFIFN